MRGRLFDKLRSLRTQASLSQKELARIVGTTAGYISRLENDPFIRIRPELRKKLADALGTTVEEVWESPYDKLVGDPGEGLVGAERTFLRTYIKFGKKSQTKIFEALKQLNEIKEIDEREKKKSRKSDF